MHHSRKPVTDALAVTARDEKLYSSNSHSFLVSRKYILKSVVKTGKQFIICSERLAEKEWKKKCLIH